MKEEKEIKVRVLEDHFSLEKLKKKIEETYNLKFGRGEKIEDIYFDTEENILFNHNQAFRIRDYHDRSLIAFKAFFNVPQRKNNPWFKLEKENKFPISFIALKEILEISNLGQLDLSSDKINRHQIESLLSSLGLKRSIVIRKIRYTTERKDFQFFLDYLENLGIFIEIETDKDLNLLKILDKLRIKYSVVKEGYTNLYAKEVLKLQIPDFDRKYKIDPDWNYLGRQKEIVQSILE